MKKLFTICAILTTMALSAQTVINFTATTSGTNTAGALDIAVNQSNMIFASTSDDILVSNDGGITFTLKSAPWTGTGLAPLLCLGNKLITNSYSSMDNGTTWNSYTPFGSAQIQRFVKIDENTSLAIAVGGGSFYKTTDGGANWGTAVFLPSAPASTQIMPDNIFSMNNGDVIVTYKNSVGSNAYYMVSKDLCTSYSYSIALTGVGGKFYNSGYVDANNKYVLFNKNGSIHGFNQNQNLTAPTFTNTYTLSGATNTVSSFAHGAYSNGNFYVIDDNATTNGILRTGSTTTTTAISELSNEVNLSVFPNPAVSQLTIQTDQTQTVSIINYSGSEIMKAQTNEPINISELSSGIYFVKAGNNMKKFIKE